MPCTVSCKRQLNAVHRVTNKIYVYPLGGLCKGNQVQARDLALLSSEPHTIRMPLDTFNQVHEVVSPSLSLSHQGYGLLDYLD
jgi:hypothetical protein